MKKKFSNGNQIYNVVLRILILALFILFQFGTYAQNGKIKVSGRVFDSSGRTLLGVSVVEKGTTNGTVSYLDGDYTITVSSPDAILSFSFIGYLTEEITVAGQSTIDISLVEDILSLDEVVVVGYGTQTKASLTAATSSVKGEILENIATNTVSSKLQGRIAGVSMTTISGRPGNELQIRIRGGSSINNSNNPLVLIDGFERSLADVNSNDIESISVLKDAAATSIYGSRASNGIILVTTKKGSTGKPKLTFDYSYGIQQFNRRYELLSAEQWLQWWRPRIVTSRYQWNNGWLTGAQPSGTGNTEESTWTTRFLEDDESVPDGWKSMTDPVTGKTLIFEDNNLQDILYRNAAQKNYNLSAVGGTESVKYAVSLGYTDQDGVAIGTNYKRVTSRGNLDFEINKRLKMSTYTDFSYSESNQFNDESDVFTRGIFNAPTIRLRFADGTPGWGTNSTLTSPLYTIETREASDKRILGNVGGNISWEIIDNLTLSASTTVQGILDTYDYFEKAHHFNESRTASAERNTNFQRQSDVLLKYRKLIAAKHSIDFLLGYSDINFNTNNASMEATGGSTDNVTTLNAEPTLVEATTTMSEERLISQFTRLNYDYDKKYLLSASIRRDGSSKFGSGNRYGYFPSASVGWVLTQEEFFPSSSVINFLKLRASYGVTGNDDIGRYVAQGVYAASYSYGGNAAILATDMPNEALTWEKTEQIDLGFEFWLFDQQRIEITADVYKRRTEDLLFSVQLSRESGFSSVDENIGTVDYKGLEFSIYARILQNTAFKWSSSFNFAYNINKVIKLPFREGVDKNRVNGTVLADGTGFGGIAEGERLNSITGYKVAYLIDNETQAASAMYDESAYGYDPETGNKVGTGVKFAGDFEWVDRDDDNQVTSYDKFVLGYEDPTTTGGFTNTFSFKSFTLDVFVDYALGHSIQDNVQSWLDGCKTQRVATTTAVLDAWQKPGDAARTNQPRSDFHDQNHQANLRASDFYTFKGDYLCFRNVNLSYKFPVSKLKYNIEMFQIYVSANNIGYLSAYKGPNPERGGALGNSGGKYPPFRTFTFGFKLGL